MRSSEAVATSDASPATLQSRPASDRRRVDEKPTTAPDEEGRIRYGGGHQEGGGMIEPDEFADGGTDVLDETPDHPDHGSDKGAGEAREADPPR